MTRVAALWDEFAAEDDFGDPLSPPTGTMSLGSVTFPAAHLVSRVYIALGADLTASYLTWNWLDITDRVRHDLGISLTVGRGDRRERVNTSRCVIKIGNGDGAFCRLNPMSPYYGLLTKNTPIWIQLDPGSGFVDRYFGYINEWPASWADASGTDSFVTIQCSGVMRRLEHGAASEPPLHRTILADGPTYYWRVEDPAGSTSAASSLPGGGRSMDVLGTVGWRQIESPPGGSPGTNAPTLNEGFLIAEVAQSAPWVIEWSVRRPTNGGLDGFPFFTIQYFLNGSLQQVSFTTGLDAAVSARDWYHYMVTAEQIGSNYELRYWRNGNAQGVVPGHSGAGTIGNSVTIYAGNQLGGAPVFGMGYFAIHGHLNVDARVHSDALQAFNGELAHVRIRRVCGEAGIPVRVLAGTSTALGPQPSGSVLAICRAAEQADQGVLFEHQFGLGYKSLFETYNQPVTFSLDFAAGHHAGVPQPRDDDSRLVNKFTASRVDGSSATAEKTDGTLGTGPGGSGIFEDSATVNVQAASQLPDYAAFRVHLGTVDEDQWPSLPFQLHRNPGLIPSWLSTRIGDRITAASPPSQMNPTTIDAIIEGYAERWDSISWDVDLATSPASPYTVAEVDSNTRVTAEGSTLSGSLTSTDMSFSLASTVANGVWTTDPADYPLDVNVGGEKIRLSAISGTTSPQTATVATNGRSVNGVVKAHASGTPVDVWEPAIVAL